MDFKPYPIYKDSGVEWLGEIPNHWGVGRLKENCIIINGYPFNSEKFDHSFGVPLVRIRDILSNKTAILFNGEVPETAIINNGDVLIGMDGDFNISQWAGGTAALNQRVCCIRSDSNILQKFLFYKLPESLKIINDLTHFTTVKHLSSVDLLKVKFGLPPKNECEQIVSFLDSETSRIDNLIAKQEKLIEKLEEHRKSVISHAVTKGLDPNVPMKDSGVEWIGNIPSHWSVKRFGYIFRENKIKNSGLIETNVLSLSYGCIKEKNIEDNKGLLPESFETYQIIQPNDIIFRFTDLQNDKRSLRSAISKFHGIITSAYIGVRTTANAEFYNYLFRAYDQQKVFYSMGDGMRQSLKIDELNRMPIVFPSDVEQQQIVSFLDSETSRIDNLIAKQEKLIEKLKSYRTSIISHAVTGKIDVRDLVA